MNFCAYGGYLGGPSNRFGEAPADYNWGRANLCCSNLRCNNCGCEVEHEDGPSARLYYCDCTDWRSTSIECLIEEGDRLPAILPPWRCLGHPVRSWIGSFPPAELDALQETKDELELARTWDRLYHAWALTPGQDAVLSVLAEARAATLLQFWCWNPQTADVSALCALLEAIDDPDQAELVARTLHRVSQASEALELPVLAQHLVFRPGFAASLIPLLDKSWLRQNASRLMESDPECAAVLCWKAARADAGWDSDALRTLPLEVLRAQAATMPRSRLRPEELDAYWERDYRWLSKHLDQLCREASDFYFYFESQLEQRSWEPEKSVLALWKEQAYDIEHAYNALPALVRYDPNWVVANLGEIIDRSRIRGVWLVDQLKQAGVDIGPLMPVLEKREPEDLKGHLALWCPESEAAGLR